MESNRGFLSSLSIYWYPLKIKTRQKNPVCSNLLLVPNACTHRDKLKWAFRAVTININMLHLRIFLTKSGLNTSGSMLHSLTPGHPISYKIDVGEVMTMTISFLLPHHSCFSVSSRFLAYSLRLRWDPPGYPVGRCWHTPQPQPLTSSPASVSKCHRALGASWAGDHCCLLR